MSTYHADPAVISALLKPEPTAAKMVRRANEKRAAGHTTGVRHFTIPGLDVAVMQRAYHPDRAQHPRQFEATFRCPTGMAQRHFEAQAHGAVGHWVSVMSKKGWDLVSEVRIRPGIYPAPDLRTNIPLLDQREFIVTASFVCRAPKPVRIELPREWLEPVVIGRN